MQKIVDICQKNKNQIFRKRQNPKKTKWHNIKIFIKGKYKK